MIPTTWVFQSTEDSGKITIFSKWPPGLDQDVTSETIQNATIPTLLIKFVCWIMVKNIVNIAK